MLYPDCMMPIKSILYVLFRVHNIDNFINLVGISASKGHYLVILRHFIQKMLSVRSKHMTLGLSCPMAKDLNDIYY